MHAYEYLQVSKLTWVSHTFVSSCNADSLFQKSSAFLLETELCHTLADSSVKGSMC